MARYALLVAVLTLSCKPHPTPPASAGSTPGAAPGATPVAAPAPAPTAVADASTGARITIENASERTVIATIFFGADTVVKGWPFCAPRDAGAGCSFMLGPKVSKALPLGGAYLNATLVFDHPGGSLCGSTKAEFNVNNPKWYDILDVSLVDGFSDKIEIIALEPSSSSTRLGPPRGKEGNEKVFGLYPYGCDVCTARQSPPCGIPAGGSGCKSGTQYKPDVPCQYQGTVLGGGTTATVRLL